MAGPGKVRTVEKDFCTAGCGFPQMHKIDQALPSYTTFDNL